MGFKRYMGEAMLGLGLATSGAACGPETPPPPASIDAPSTEGSIEKPRVLTPEQAQKQIEKKKEAITSLFTTDTWTEPNKAGYDQIDGFTYTLTPDDIIKYLDSISAVERSAAVDKLKIGLAKVEANLNDPAHFDDMTVKDRTSCLFPNGVYDFIHGVLDRLSSGLPGQ